MGVSRRDHRPGTCPGAVAVAGCWRRQHGIHSWPGRTHTFRAQFHARHRAALEKFPHSDPPTRAEFTACRDWIKKFLHDEVRPGLEPRCAASPVPNRRIRHAPVFSLASPKGGEGRGEEAQGFTAQIPSPQPSPRGERETGAVSRCADSKPEEIQLVGTGGTTSILRGSN